MLATEARPDGLNARPPFWRRGDVLLDWLLRVAKEVRWSGMGKYALALAILVLGIFWDFQADEGALPLDQQAYFTMVAISVTTLLGAGPGVVAAVALFVAAYTILDFGMSNQEAGAVTGVFLLTLIAANAVALKSTFWRMRAERQGLRAGRLAEQLKLLTDGAVHYALYMTDGRGRIVHWNLGAERFTGWMAGDVMGKPVTDLYAGDPEMTHNLARTFALAQEHGSCEFDSAFTRADGTSFLQNCVVTALYDDKGELQGYAKLVRDVTGERAHEAKLQEREAELRSILETAPEAVFIVNEHGRIDYSNAAACRMFGFDMAQLLGHSFNDLLPPGQSGRAVPRDIKWEKGDASKSLPRRLIGRRNNGSHFPIEMTFVRMERAGDKHSTAFIRDLTEQDATQARLEALQAEMLHGTRYSAMGAMASMLAHELNQPLTALAAYMEGSAILLKRDEALDRNMLARTFGLAAAEAIRAGAIMQRLRSFVSDGEAQLEVHDIHEVVNSSIALISAAAEAAAVHVTIDIDNDAGPIFADPIQIQQVIGNLCRNAIDAMRDTHNRFLTVRAYAADDLMTHVMIKDTGSGIPPEIQDRIFDAFVSKKETGTGVGLSICRTIVEAHGGKIWVEPAQSGSCFGFSLKRKKE